MSSASQGDYRARTSYMPLEVTASTTVCATSVRGLVVSTIMSAEFFH